MKLFFALMSLMFVLVSCSHHRDVRPSSDGIHRVVIQTDDTPNAQRQALDQANHFCKEKNKSHYAAVVDEKTTYTGDMDEETYKTTKRASKVATTVGGTAMVFGGKKESNLGGVVGLGGAAADAAAGQGYTVEMRFKCM